MPNNNIKEIIKEYLINNGYDGLLHPNGGCGCLVDQAFMDMCDNQCEFNTKCQAAYKVYCDCGSWNLKLTKDK